MIIQRVRGTRIISVYFPSDADEHTISAFVDLAGDVGLLEEHPSNEGRYFILVVDNEFSVDDVESSIRGMFQ